MVHSQVQNRSIISYGRIAENKVKFLELNTMYAMLKKKP